MKFHTIINQFYCSLSAFLLLAACTQDEMPDNGNTLPEGKYPLEIASVTMDVSHSQQPWSADAPQTRVSENPDGNSSSWEEGDKIKVQIGNGTPGTYTYQDGSLTIAEGDAPAYWASKADGQSILAWHTSSGSKTVELDNQTEELAYLLTAQATANFNTLVSLSFTHALAKVRVKLQDYPADDVTDVKIKTCTSCTLNSDGTLTAGGTEDFIPMVKATYNGETFWEANVMPDCKITEIKVNGYKSTLSTPLISQVAKINTITLDTKPIIPEDAREITGDINISDDGDYVVTGECTGRITITAGSPNIYLKDANINVEDIRNDNAIHITGGSPTIHVLGENNVSVPYGAGIFVAEGYTVTIVGYKREDKLTARGGNGGSGIGASLSANAGNIHISNVTVEAHGSGLDGLSAGIGGALMYSCGTITIENATVHAYGTLQSDIITPGIGSGYPYGGGNPPSIPVVTISNSEIHTHRSSNGNGGNADYIGWGSDNYYPNNTPANSTINLGVGGMCTGSTIYCYTGDTLDKTVTYDANGNGTEQ